MAATSPRSEPEAAWRSWRDARDELFRSHPQTPLKVDERARFGGLSYFPYDPTYRMTAIVEATEEPADWRPRSGAAADQRPAALLVPADRSRDPVGTVGRRRSAGVLDGGLRRRHLHPVPRRHLRHRDIRCRPLPARHDQGRRPGRHSGRRRAACWTSTSPTTRRAHTTRGGTARWRRPTAVWQSLFVLESASVPPDAGR